MPLGAFQSVESEEQLAAAAEAFGFPLMLKSRRMAYDGKGNAVAKTAADVAGGGGEARRVRRGACTCETVGPVSSASSR